VIDVPANVLVKISTAESSESVAVHPSSERVTLGMVRGESWGLLAANLLILDAFFGRLESNNGINDPSLQSPQTHSSGRIDLLNRPYLIIQRK